MFPGQTLRMPASVINGLTNSQVVTDRNNDKSTRLRFTTTAVHRYEVKTVTLDAAIAYFAGIREIQPYVVKYIDYEDDNIIPGSSAQHPEFKFDSYDKTTNWSFVNVNQLATGPNCLVVHGFSDLSCRRYNHPDQKIFLCLLLSLP